jgi:hypothetical protein
VLLSFLQEAKIIRLAKIMAVGIFAKKSSCFILFRLKNLTVLVKARIWTICTCGKFK